MKIAIVGDPHLGGCLAKHREMWHDYALTAPRLVEMARGLGATALLLPGDVADAPVVDGGVCLAMKTLIEGFDQVFFVEGNHDRQRAPNPHPMEVLGGVALRNGEPVTSNAGVVLAGWHYELRKDFREKVAEAVADAKADLIVIHQYEMALQGFTPDFDRRDVKPESGWIVCGHTHVRDLDAENRFLSPGALFPQSLDQVDRAGAIYLYDSDTREITKADVEVPFRKVVKATIGCDADLIALRENVAAAHTEDYGAPYVVLEMLPRAPVADALEIVKNCPRRVDRRGLVLDDVECDGVFLSDAGNRDAGSRMLDGLEKELREDEADVKDMATDLIRNTGEDRMRVLRRELDGDVEKIEEEPQLDLFN